MSGQDTAAECRAPVTPNRQRARMVALVESAETGRAMGRGVRATAAEAGVASSTLYHWLGQKAGIDASPASRDYFVSPEGLALLHRIVTAAHLVFVQAGGCGADRVSEFLKLSELDRFVGASHGSQHRVMTRMTELLGTYADAERRRLGAAMAAKTIVVCEDETFHPETCLVAIDADSGLILVEQYSDRRDGATWTKALADALAGLPATGVQVVGDAAQGRIAQARHGRTVRTVHLQRQQIVAADAYRPGRVEVGDDPAFEFEGAVGGIVRGARVRLALLVPALVHMRRGQARHPLHRS